MGKYYICDQFCKTVIQGVSKNLLESGEQYIVASRFSSGFFQVSDKRRINAARIILFKFYN